MKTKKYRFSGDKILEIVFLLVVFNFTFLWAFVAPFDASPDEGMKYDVVSYILNVGKLPAGYDPAIRNANWGISYAFNPIIPYIIGAWFAKVAQLFTDSFQAAYIAARTINVIFGTLTAYFTLKIGKRLFTKEVAYFMASLVSFLPGVLFINSYINTDSMALFSSAWIIYCWVKAAQDGWTNGLCVELAIALGVCTLSYYNAYGYLLCSALYFCGMFCKCQNKQWDFRAMLKKGFMILGIVFIIAGWWFIRSAILYDGDFLGMRTSTMYSEMYAIEDLKPSNRETPQNLGMSIPGMMIFQPGTWKYNWIGTVIASFIGTFGQMDIFMPEFWTKGYFLIVLIGGVGVLVKWKQYFRVAVERLSIEKKKIGNDVQILIKLRKNHVWNTENWMRICLVLAGLIPCVLLVYYSYCSDFQAQGRYIMPGCIPLMYFITLGFDTILTKFVKNDNIRKWIFRILLVAWIISAVLVYKLVYAVNY